MKPIVLQRAWTRVARTRAAVHSAIRLVAASGALVIAAACGSDIAPKASTAQAESASASAKASSIISPDTAGRTLARASGAQAYHVDETEGARGTIRGEITLFGVLPLDTTVVPDRDSTGCRPFSDVTFPLTRGVPSAKHDSTEHTIGNAIVWLMGVTHGPRDNLPRRVNLVLDGCHLEPRVLVAPIGATLNISNRDNMLVKLKFADLDHTSTPRATIGFTDPGQVVPTVLPLANPGLVEVVDENHQWVRGFIAVAPHPFVAVTEADGAFEFAGVPAGEYTLVVWHERLGARVVAAKVEAGVTRSIAVKY